ncbi:aminoglycoside 3'-phosphotransferase/choline kinase domain protein [Trichoderma harzianum]|uniref:non-specific serine/threonine protein kinase n=1 Tax=Trichoderma harzianum TaxID=5544 RepID=A0A0F9Y0K4_TRIHA|nr:aminoglycoside 3'-phosphotransferase/choline kinase domain protein [Trichoderma harzianum]
MNHEQYHQRIDFVKSLLQLNALQSKSIDPIEYVMDCPFPYNNFIYHVTLESPISRPMTIKSSQSDKAQPGTVPFPAHSASLLIRLSNSDPRTGLNNNNRVENEVAFMVLVRQALAKTKYSHIIPDVYSWADTDSGQAFTMQQYMPGTIPAKTFEALSLEDKSIVLGQMADILALLQQFDIPKTVEMFGGLKFDEHGNVASGQMSLFKGEPSTTYKDFIRSIFKIKLQEADENPVIVGWEENGLRAKLDKFIGHQLDEILKDYEQVRRVLIHGDLTTNNILFDANTLQVTALLDFDFSYVATAAEEFFGFSFGNISGGKLPGPFETGANLSLRQAMLSGFRTPFLNADTSTIQWDVAKAWDKELVRAGAAKPATIPHFEDIADIYWLQDKISPFELDSPVMRRRKTAEQLRSIRNETEEMIVKFLDRFNTSSGGDFSN